MIQTAPSPHPPGKAPKTPPPRGTGMFTLAAFVVYLLTCVAIGFQHPTLMCGSEPCPEHATR